MIVIARLETLGVIARAACGCLSCTGAKAVGGHTLAGNAPQLTPSSCLAPVYLESFLGLEKDEVAALIKEWEAR